MSFSVSKAVRPVLRCTVARTVDWWKASKSNVQSGVPTDWLSKRTAPQDDFHMEITRPPNPSIFACHAQPLIAAEGLYCRTTNTTKEFPRSVFPMHPNVWPHQSLHGDLWPQQSA
ncbi:hypothetical protein PMIN06_005217 [Paraphaeosphaeria minitans]